MKRCVSCGKDIVDAAVNCVFCGSKQTDADALKRTVLGYSTPAPQPAAAARPSASFTPAALTPQPFTPPPSPAPPVRDATPSPVAAARMPAPARPASEPPVSTPSHQLYPFEPWARPLRIVMIVFGLVLLATSAAPSSIGETLAFAWQPLLGGDTSFAAIYPVAMGAAGLLLALVALLPVIPAVRGAIACLAGVGLVVAGPIVSRDLRVATVFAASAVAGAGLLVRGAYRASLAGRLVATAGALAAIGAYVVPLAGGAIPLLGLLDRLREGAAQTIPAVSGITLVAVALVTVVAAWLPQRTSAAGTLLAWIWILLMPLGVLATDLSSPISAPGVLYDELQTLALQAIGAYGLATLIGKGCEQRP